MADIQTTIDATSALRANRSHVLTRYQLTRSTYSRKIRWSKPPRSSRLRAASPSAATDRSRSCGSPTRRVWAWSTCPALEGGICLHSSLDVATHVRAFTVLKASAVTPAAATRTASGDGRALTEAQFRTPPLVAIYPLAEMISIDLRDETARTACGCNTLTGMLATLPRGHRGRARHHHTDPCIRLRPRRSGHSASASNRL
jgi:hypothetical protein